MKDLNLDTVISELASGDPIVGNHALESLVEAGLEGEAAFLDRPINFAYPTQYKRRLLRYVASCEATIKDKLLERVMNPKPADDPEAVAFLLAGTKSDSRWNNSAFQIFQSGFNGSTPTQETLRNHFSMSPRFLAWGNLGGNGSSLWHLIRSDDFCWEKFRGIAFRAACAFTARVDADGLWAIEQMITHEWNDTVFKVGKIPPDQANYRSNSAIGKEELWEQVFYGSFSMWKRGELADAILTKWSDHQYVRVREFGASILGSLQLKRTVPKLIEWYEREVDSIVSLALLESIGRIYTAEGVDFLLKEWQNGNKDTSQTLAQVAWKAGNQSMAKEILTELEKCSGNIVCQALVASAKCGRRSPLLENFLKSIDSYHRQNAALAVGYLKDSNLLPLVAELHSESSNPMESLFLCAAMAIAGESGAPERLRIEMQKVAEEPEFKERIDIFFLSGFLQDALIDGLKAGGHKTEIYYKAWRAETGKFDSIPKKVIINQPKIRTPAKNALNNTNGADQNSTEKRPEDAKSSISHSASMPPDEEAIFGSDAQAIDSERGILAFAIRNLPAFRYIVGAAGILILAAIVIQMGLNLVTISMVAAVLLIGGVVLIVFSWVPNIASKGSSKLAGVLVWFAMVTFMLTIVCLFSSAVSDYPWQIKSWIDERLQQDLDFGDGSDEDSGS